MLGLSFFNLKFKKQRIPSDFKNVVYRTTMRYGTQEDFEALYQIALKTNDVSEKLRMLRGLASTQNYQLLKLYFLFYFIYFKFEFLVTNFF